MKRKWEQNKTQEELQKENCSTETPPRMPGIKEYETLQAFRDEGILTPEMLLAYPDDIRERLLDFLYIRTTPLHKELIRKEKVKIVEKRRKGDIDSANIVSGKRAIKPSNKILNKIPIPIYQHKDFSQSNKAQNLYKYMMSKDGKEACKDKKLYKKKYPHDPTFPPLTITGEQISMQLAPGFSECEQEILGIVLEEWKRMEVSNTEEKFILHASFTNISF